MEELKTQYPEIEGIMVVDESDEMELSVVRELQLPISEEESDKKLDIFRISVVK